MTGPIFRIIALPWRPPHSRLPSFPGLTSFLRRLGLHLLSLLALDGAQRQHDNSTGVPYGPETEQLVPGRWSRGPRCGSQRPGGLRQLHPLPKSSGPQQPNGHVGNATRIELLQGPVCDLGSVWHGVWQGKGQHPWVYDPLRNTRNMTQSASTLDVQLSKLVQKGPLEAGIQQALSKRTRGAVPGLSFSSVPGLPGSLPKGFRQALPSCPRPLQVHKASVSPSGPR